MNSSSVPRSRVQSSSAAPAASVATGVTQGAGATPLRLLSYVHLRNIHASTGAGRTARQITEHLARRADVDLHVLADRGDKDRILPLVGEPWTTFKYHTFAQDTSRQQAQWYLRDAPKAESYWPDAQVVFCTGESYVPTGTARLVMTAHDAGYFEKEAHHRDLSYWKQRLKWSALFRKLVRRVDLFHTVSEFSAERLQHFFPSMRGRILPVHNGVTPHFYAPVPEAGLQYLRTEGLASRPYLLVPGGLHFRKNAELVLEGARLLLQRYPELVVAVVNHSNPIYAARAKELGDRFRLLGFVSDEALHALYARAEVVWFPSRYEGFGLPVVEAMAAGGPVVASRAASIPEIAGDAALLADPTKVTPHLEAIESVLGDQQVRAALIEKGHRRAEHFTWERCAAELKQKFDTLV